MNALAGPLLLVGSGKMGAALLRGWLDNGLLNDLIQGMISKSAMAGFDFLRQRCGIKGFSCGRVL